MRTVVVTGGARGIGAAIAQKFAVSGWRTLTPSRTDLDLSDSASIEKWLTRPDAQEVDTLVNNAAENIIADLWTLDDAAWSRMIQINLTAPFQLLRAVTPAMAARRWGRVVNIGSAFTFVSRSNRAGYTSTKTGLLGLTRAAAIELAPKGILVNLISPGFIGTDMTRQNNSPEQIASLTSQIPAGRLGTPEEVAELAFFLGSENNTYITGAAIPIDGGFLCQ